MFANKKLFFAFKLYQKNIVYLKYRFAHELQNII